MVRITKSLTAIDKLDILSRDSQYDLACSCDTRKDGHRRRSRDNKWVYPVALPQGGQTFLFKTLLSNHCVNDCKYCPIRANQDPRRCTLEPEELVKTFFQYYRARRVSGLFLSSGVVGSPESTMSRMNTIAGKLRQSSFRGYIHLKIIPGASEAAIQHSLSLASAVSLNIEAAGEKNFNQLCASKSYSRDIIGSIKFISRLTAKGAPYSRVKQTTQFVVGAASDTDEDIVSHTWELYKKLNLNRVYFSAYQRGLGEANLPGERKSCSNSDILMREHRLYQVDWLLRKYGFRAEEVPFDIGGNLSLSIDPKEAWAKRHPEFFPVNVNRAAKEELLRVPGLGEVAVNRIFERRVNGHRLSRIENLGKPGKLLRKASHYISY